MGKFCEDIWLKWVIKIGKLLEDVGPSINVNNRIYFYDWFYHNNCTYMREYSYFTQICTKGQELYGPNGPFIAGQ